MADSGGPPGEFDADDDANKSIRVPVVDLYEEFKCPVCFLLMTDVYMTPCGHNFCSECIRQCLNTKHCCPMCNQATVVETLTKNHHADNVLQILKRECDAAKQEYFMRLVQNRDGAGQPHVSPDSGTPTGTGDGSSSPVGGAVALSPGESILQKHTHRLLAAFEGYSRRLANQHKVETDRLHHEQGAAMAQCHDRFAAKMKGEDHAAAGRIQTGMKLELQRVIEEYDVRLASGQERFMEMRGRLLTSFDEYLSQMTVSPAFLPMSVMLVVPSRELRIGPVMLQPADAVEALNRYLVDGLAALKEEVVSFTKRNIWTLYRVDNDGFKQADAILLKDNGARLAQYGVENGSELHLLGELSLKSDEPRKCYKLLFDKQGNDTCDYFKCKTCGSNWICSFCAEDCHRQRGHEVVPYLIRHRTTWGCCYCTRGGAHLPCRLQGGDAK